MNNCDYIIPVQYSKFNNVEELEAVLNCCPFTIRLSSRSFTLFTPGRHEHTLWPFLRSLLALSLPGFRRQRDTLLFTSPLLDPTYWALLVGSEEKGRAGWESKVEKERDVGWRGQRTKKNEERERALWLCQYENKTQIHPCQDGYLLFLKSGMIRLNPWIEVLMLLLCISMRERWRTEGEEDEGCMI